MCVASTSRAEKAMEERWDWNWSRSLNLDSVVDTWLH